MDGMTKNTPPLVPVMNTEEVNRLMGEVYPQLNSEYADYVATDVFPGGCTVRLNANERHLRPGGTVSGPAMFSLADVAAYVATLARIGKQALTVTTHCSIDFMRKPAAGVDLLAEARVLKLGRTLSVTDVLLFSEGQAKPLAHASLTYSIPPGR